MARVGAHSQHKIRDRKNKKRIFWFVFGFTLISLSIWGLSYLSFLPSVTIDEVKVSDSLSPNNEAIKIFTEERLAKNLLFFFSGKNSLIYQGSQIEKGLKENFPEIREVNLSLFNFKILSIEGTLREPVALWCESGGTSSCFTIDESGFSFLQEKFDGQALIFRVTGNTPKSADRVMPEDVFKNMIFFVRELKASGLDLSSVVVESPLEIRLNFRLGGVMILDQSDDFSQILVRVRALLGDKDLGFGTPTFMKNLEYVDIRYGNKIIYKFNN
jgi:hypothetical protein